MLFDGDQNPEAGVSFVPTQLLDPLNADEVLDLLSYLISGGNAAHGVFAASGGQAR